MEKEVKQNSVNSELREIYDELLANQFLAVVSDIASGRTKLASLFVPTSSSSDVQTEARIYGLQCHVYKAYEEVDLLIMTNNQESYQIMNDLIRTDVAIPKSIKQRILDDLFGGTK